jgi:hypothetical protein
MPKKNNNSHLAKIFKGKRVTEKKVEKAQKAIEKVKQKLTKSGSGKRDFLEEMFIKFIDLIKEGKGTSNLIRF